MAQKTQYVIEVVIHDGNSVGRDFGGVLLEP